MLDAFENGVRPLMEEAFSHRLPIYDQRVYNASLAAVAAMTPK